MKSNEAWSELDAQQRRLYDEAVKNNIKKQREKNTREKDELLAQKQERLLALEAQKKALSGCWHVASSKFSDRDIEDLNTIWQSDRYDLFLIACTRCADIVGYLIV